MEGKENWLEIDRLVKEQKAFFNSGATLAVSVRKRQLRILQEAIKVYEPALMEALQEDLGKSPFEAYETEIAMVRSELRHTLKHLSQWMEPEDVKTPLVHFPGKSRIYKEPLGVALILSPWNYPFQLAFAPLIASMAAGNCTVIKPSRHAPNTAEVMARLVQDYFESGYISVVTGGDNSNEVLLSQRFDHIFFTGSPSVGKVVMKAAADNLIPVTLELGGKSPCIVDETANIDMAARRIIWGKTLNAGQTCVAPDFVLVQRTKKDALIQAMGAYIKAYYGDEPLNSKDLPRIINQRHFHRLEALIQNGRVCFGGKSDIRKQKIEPTILTDITRYNPLMQQEIFGPLLPVLAYDQLDDAIRFVRDGEKPLSLYFFSKNKKAVKKVLQKVSFGGGCINDTILHLANPHLPFGGVGQSGMGSYHGRRGFDTFSHEKSVMKRSNLLDIPLRYPPYGNKLKLLKKVMK